MGVPLAGAASTEEDWLASPSPGLTKATATKAISAAAPPERPQSSRHPVPQADAAATIAADAKMPTPTPAKWIEASSLRLAAVSRASTNVDAQTITKALAKPPAKRAAKMAISVGKKPVAAVEIALTASPWNNHLRGAEEKIGRPAVRAPTR